MNRRIMDGNLTLTINESVLENARKYANQRGVNLSVIVEDFLFKLTSGSKAKKGDEIQERKAVRRLPDRFRDLKGALAEVDTGNREDARLNYLLKKYR